MSSFGATLTVAGLYGLLLLPLAIAVRRPAATIYVAGAYAIISAVTMSYQSGLFARADLPGDLAVDSPVVAGAQCTEVLLLLDRAGAIIDRSRPPSLVVDQNRWAQLPEEAQQVVVNCVERSWPPAHRPARLEVRTR